MDGMFYLVAKFSLGFVAPLLLALLPRVGITQNRKQWWVLLLTMGISAAFVIPVGLSFLGLDRVPLSEGIFLQLAFALLALIGAPIASFCNVAQGRRLWLGPSLCVLGLIGAYITRQIFHGGVF